MGIQHITVEQFYNDMKSKLKMKLLTSRNGFSRQVVNDEIHRPGLALAGFIELFTYDRIQVLGNTEIKYLFSLGAKERKERIEKYLEFEIPAILVTDSNPVPHEFLEAALKRQISVFQTTYETTVAFHILVDYLHQQFAPKTGIHGSLVDVYGVGILITGRSGIGKSEITLDLVERGHRLVADDTVIITRKADEIIMGEPAEMGKNHIEIRGLGLIDVRRMFGIRALRIQKRVEIEIKLVDFNPDEVYERVGMDEVYTEILGVKIPQITLPINPGKNITVIAETIALNQLLKIYGHNAAKEFNEKLMLHIMEKEREHLNKLKMRAFLDKDFE